VILRLAILVQCRLLSDRQADGWTQDGSIYRASVESRGKKRWAFLLFWPTL